MKKLLFCLALTSYIASAILKMCPKSLIVLPPCKSGQRIETITRNGCPWNVCVKNNCPSLNLQEIECKNGRIETITDKDGCHENICVEKKCPQMLKALTCPLEDQITKLENGCPITSCKNQ